jgi:hypothetical protein
MLRLFADEEELARIDGEIIREIEALLEAQLVELSIPDWCYSDWNAFMEDYDMAYETQIGVD